MCTLDLLTLQWEASGEPYFRPEKGIRILMLIAIHFSFFFLVELNYVHCKKAMDEKYIKEVQFTPQKVGYLLCTLTYIYKTRKVMESSYEHSCENLDTVANTVYMYNS